MFTPDTSGIRRAMERVTRAAHALSMDTLSQQGGDRLLARWRQDLGPQIVSQVTQSFIDYANRFEASARPMRVLSRELLEAAEPDTATAQNLASLLRALGDAAAGAVRETARLRAEAATFAERFRDAEEYKNVTQGLDELVGLWDAIAHQAMSLRVHFRVDSSASDPRPRLARAPNPLNDVAVERATLAWRETRAHATALQALCLGPQ